MNTFKIIKYTSEYYNLWNDFVAKAKNATFLFHRDFMEYHSDRFVDYSLLIFDEKEVLRDSTTYSINFGSAITDFTEANPVTNFQFIENNFE